MVFPVSDIMPVPVAPSQVSLHPHSLPVAKPCLATLVSCADMQIDMTTAVLPRFSLVSMPVHTWIRCNITMMQWEIFNILRHTGHIRKFTHEMSEDLSA